MLADQADYVLGVDTHRDTHSIAVLAAGTAVVQGQITVAASERGYLRLLRYARESAPGRRAWAIEGTGSYGAGLATFLRQQGELVLEIDRPRRAQHGASTPSPMSWTRSARQRRRFRASTSLNPVCVVIARRCAYCSLPVRAPSAQSARPPRC